MSAHLGKASSQTLSPDKHTPQRHSPVLYAVKQRLWLETFPSTNTPQTLMALMPLPLNKLETAVPRIENTQAKFSKIVHL